jgi:hypothetical protein
LHASHLIERCPGITNYLDLPAGSRFLIAPGQDDVWTDEPPLECDARNRTGAASSGRSCDPWWATLGLNF